MSEQVEMEEEDKGTTVAAATTVIASGEKKRFEVKKWNAVALWAWGLIFNHFVSIRVVKVVI